MTASGACAPALAAPKELCPQCGSGYVHTSRPRTPGEAILEKCAVGIRRCHNCDFRYLNVRKWIVAASGIRAIEVGMVLFAALALVAVILIRRAG